jgi:hypothetical protein
MYNPETQTTLILGIRHKTKRGHINSATKQNCHKVTIYKMGRLHFLYLIQLMRNRLAFRWFFLLQFLGLPIIK